ncbi:MAG: ABC transporter substrate-binding protein [Oscillospiraceae bacterium]|jgi:NitT/TauT family transport system substrate-binding protein|nr:ABC transporter substrate-binding protein [Oscillospiraceae bacterium]
MKRVCLAFCALLPALLLLTACAAGNGAQTPTPPAAGTPAETPAEPTGTAPATPAPAPAPPALEQTSFKLGHLNSTAHLLGFVAAEEGYFAEEGLDAELLLFASAGEMVAGLESGNLDAAFIGSVPTITFQSQDHPVSVFGGAMTNGHGYVIKSEFTEGLSDWDITILKGRNVATVKNSVQELELYMLLDQAGLDRETDLNVVVFDSQKDAFNALAGAEIDAASVYSPYASIAKNQGYEVVYYCNEEPLFENQPCCRQVALTQALADKPNTYTAFERALIKAYKFSQEDREKTIQDVKKYIDIELDALEYEIYGGHSLSHPDPDKAATAALQRKVVDFGYTTNYDIETRYNTEIYAGALNSLLAENPDDTLYRDLLAHFEANDV